jgi:6-phosphogluconolactonase
MTSVQVCEDPAAGLAVILGEVAGAGGHIALTGGSSPARAYALARAADWRGATIWFTDERCVAPDDERSNYGMAARALLDHVAVGRVVRMEGERGPAAGAAAYAAQLEEALGPAPRLDLAVLGLGSDGHVASLFPGRPEIDERAASVVGVPEAGLEPFVARVSLTLPVINAARRRVFLVTGAGKARAVARVFGARREPTLPAALVQDPLVLLDAAAAGEL